VPSLPALRPETSSLTAIEAAARGRPVLASDDPAVVEVVDALGCGLVTPAGHRQGLAAAMRQVLGDDELVRRLAETGAERTGRRNAPQPVAAAYVSVYRRAIAEAGRPR
jgi:glycosyltransferase involved in cell wall biosynthesis